MTNWFDENEQNTQYPTEGQHSAGQPIPPSDNGDTAPTESPASYSPTWQESQNSGSPYRSPYQSPVPQPPVPQPPKKPKKNRKMAIFTAILAIVCTVSLCAAVVLALDAADVELPNGGTNNGTSAGDKDTNKNDGNTGATDKNTPQIDISEPEEEGLTSKQIIQQNLPSVVTLTVYTESRNMFGEYGALTQSGVASGIVWTEDGYIITNSHCVVDENTGTAYPRVDVHMSDGTVYEDVEIIGADSSTDLAVIKVKKEDLKTKLTPVTFGDSSAVAMGDKVIAIGNPGGLGLTATQGIISGLARDVYEDTGYAIPCIQVDAAINPGNSGGPLFNANGQVIAINSSKIVATGYEGLGFAIPINEAKEILDDLVKKGHVSGRVALGVTGKNISTTGIEGFYIVGIEEDSCLKGTGVREGDIIIYVGKTRVTDYSSLRASLAKHEVGDTVKLTLLRYNETTRMFNEYSVTAVLGESKD